jgi:uncharacterized protein
VSINENADLDPSQVEDMRGRSGGVGGGGGIGGSGLSAGAGCLTALLPLFRRNPKLGIAAVILAVVCIGGFVRQALPEGHDAIVQRRGEHGVR